MSSMNSTLRKLEALATERKFAPLPDASTPEVDAVCEALGAGKMRAVARTPGNDLYSHLIECEFNRELRARFLIRFDLRVFVVLPYVMNGRLWELATGHAKLQALCAPLVSRLLERKFEQITFAEAMGPLAKDAMLEQGFIDNTVLGYFFESL
ncbi:hypothetical protein SAMN05216569_0507 [Pseudoxanthomonas sp. CF125]|nr:hypothetical protein SAMN05216569_0507 [Pseudoxanthomonas sp. CF125]